jgi:hypothetical protein
MELADNVHIKHMDDYYEGDDCCPEKIDWKIIVHYSVDQPDHLKHCYMFSILTKRNLCNIYLHR